MTAMGSVLAGLGSRSPRGGPVLLRSGPVAVISQLKVRGRVPHHPAAVDRRDYGRGSLWCLGQPGLGAARIATPGHQPPKTLQIKAAIVCQEPGGRVFSSGSSGERGLQTAAGEAEDENGQTAACTELDFDCPAVFRGKTAGELLRAWLVLKLSSYPTFVDHSLQIMTISQRILGRRLYNLAARASFYGHFIAGDGEAEARQLYHRFEEQSIATILACTVEEDIGEYQGYDEARYDRNMKAYIKCMDLTLDLSRRFRPVSQLKMTSFSKADVLARVTEILSAKGWYYQNDSPLSVWNMVKGLDGEMVPVPDLDDKENEHLRNILQRLNQIGQQAIHNDCQILVDAERINVNDGITLITLALMTKFNKEKPHIWNTYQCYLKRTSEALRRDLEWVEGQGLCFGIKIVRGAYIEWERKNALQLQREDPVNPDFQATCDMYNGVVDYMLTYAQKHPGRCGVMVASHNKESVHKALARMEELGMKKLSGDVIFGQVLGIADQITKKLGEAGFLIYKSSPYGPIEDVLPYLARRAQENNSIFKNLGAERGLILKELRQRVRPF